MRRTVVQSVARLGIVFLLLCLFACGDGPSKKEAKEAIDKHIKDCYGLVIPSTFIYSTPPTSRYWSIALAKNLGLADTALASTVAPTLGADRTFEMTTVGDKFNVTLAEKGSAAAHVEDGNGYVVFLISQNTVEEVVSVGKGDDKLFWIPDAKPDDSAAKSKTKQKYIALFSCVNKYTAFGKTIADKTKEYHLEWPDDNTKLRGKALLVYDDFLKKYTVKGLMISKWEKEEWRFPVWFTDSKGTNFLYHNLEGTQQPTTVAQEQEAMRQDEAKAALIAQRDQERAKFMETMYRVRAEHQRAFEDRMKERIKAAEEARAERQRLMEERAKVEQERQDRYRARRPMRQMRTN